MSSLLKAGEKEQLDPTRRQEVVNRKWRVEMKITRKPNNMLKSTFYTLYFSVDPISLSCYISDGILSQFYVYERSFTKTYVLVKIHVGLVEAALVGQSTFP